MATYDQAGPGAGALPQRSLASTANWAGAVVSLCLIVGVGVWGYRLVMRDVSGIPVVQASEGPMRIAPEDPGGEAADHQGLSVNDVAGFGTAADPADTLTLAPRPVELSGEDVALGEIAPQADPAPRETLDEERRAAARLALEEADDPIQALADQIAAGLEPLSAAEVAASVPVVAKVGPLLTPDDDGDGSFLVEDDTADIPDANATTAVLDVEGGVARSLRPKVRPTELRTVALAPVAVPQVAETPELDPESLPDGTRLVQLGAYESPEVARAEWDRLDARFGEYLDGRARVIERATSGGRIFYRLRAHGFDDISDARRFCAALVAENADCIPVVSR